MSPRAGFDRGRLPEPLAYFEGEGLTLTGRGRWRSAACQFHGGSDSMRINVESGGWCCMACGERGGDVLAYAMQAHALDFMTAARRLGAWVDGPGPARIENPKTLAPRDAMEVVAAELLIIWIVVGDALRGLLPSDADWQRFTVAVGRIEAIAQDYRA